MNLKTYFLKNETISDYFQGLTLSGGTEGTFVFLIFFPLSFNATHSF